MIYGFATGAQSEVQRLNTQCAREDGDVLALGMDAVLAQQPTITAGSFTHEVLRFSGGVSSPKRGGSGNSDSVVSGSLASPKPPDGGEPEERGDEANTTESRSDV